MTAVPTRSMAHRALVRWDETGGYLPQAACAWVRVSMYPCALVRTLPHIMRQCGGHCQNCQFKEQAKPRPTSADQERW